jgi:hypothetical protein
MFCTCDKEGSLMKLFPVVLAVALVVAAIAAVSPAQAGLFGHHRGAADCCAPVVPVCAPEPVCCIPAPPPVNVTICVKDPVTCCVYQVEVCVPAECACEAPCLESCRPGILGRKVLTYSWPCCGHCVEVVITKHGKTIVR